MILKRIYKYLFLLFATGIAGMATAQQLPLTGQYLFNPYALSPAHAGTFGSSEVFMNYRKDWANFNGSPQTFHLNGNGRVYNNMWLGGEIMADQADIFYRFKAALSYTYRIQMANDQFLSFGLSGKLFQSLVRVDQVNADLTDPLLRDISRITGTTFNAGFGLVYSNNNLNIGFGMPILFRSKDAYLNQSEGRFAFERAFEFHVFDRYTLSNQLQVQPFFLWQKTNNQPAVFDASVMFIFLDRFWLSGLYRSSSLIALGIGGELYRGFIMNYSYEIGTGGINYRSGGSHEFTLGYRISIGDGFSFGNSGGGWFKGRTRQQAYPEVIDYSNRRRYNQ